MTEAQPSRRRPIPANANKIAELCGVAPDSVTRWARRYDDFPDAVQGTNDRNVPERYWDWNEVKEWLVERSKWDEMVDMPDIPLSGPRQRRQSTADPGMGLSF